MAAGKGEGGGGEEGMGKGEERGGEGRRGWGRRGSIGWRGGEDWEQMRKMSRSWRQASKRRRRTVRGSRSQGTDRGERMGWGMVRGGVRKNK